MVKVGIVVPSNRPENLQRFFEEWRGSFKSTVDMDIAVYVIEDNDGYSIVNANFVHVNRHDIIRDLGTNLAWIIPTFTDCIRSYGFLKAYRDKCDVIVSLDDDCYPSDHKIPFLRTHVNTVTSPVEQKAWTTTHYPIPRGHPYETIYRQKRCILSHGMWIGNPDYDSITSLSMLRETGADPAPGISFGVIPQGAYFPMCGMNIAFHRDLTPAMYQLLMGKLYPYDRFGDIWSGIIVKKIIDHLGLAVNSGLPLIRHSRASNMWANLMKETPGLKVNELFWTCIDNIVLTKTTIVECYDEIIQKVEFPKEEYFYTLKKAMSLWLSLFRVNEGSVSPF